MQSIFQSGLKGHWRHPPPPQHPWAAPSCHCPPRTSSQCWCPHSPHLPRPRVPSCPAAALWGAGQRVPAPAFLQHPGVRLSRSGRRTKICEIVLAAGAWQGMPDLAPGTDAGAGWELSHGAVCLTLGFCKIHGAGRMLGAPRGPCRREQEHGATPFPLHYIYLLTPGSFFFPNKFICHVNYNLVICHCVCRPCLDAQGR